MSQFLFLCLFGLSGGGASPMRAHRVLATLASLSQLAFCNAATPASPQAVTNQLRAKDKELSSAQTKLAWAAQVRRGLPHRAAAAGIGSTAAAACQRSTAPLCCCSHADICTHKSRARFYDAG